MKKIFAVVLVCLSAAGCKETYKPEELILPDVIRWSKLVGGSSEDNYTKVIKTNDGNYLAVGKSYSSDGDVGSNKGMSDVLISKFNTDGSVQWQRMFSGSAEEITSSVVQTNDGGYIIAGTTGSND